MVSTDETHSFGTGTSRDCVREVGGQEAAVQLVLGQDIRHPQRGVGNQRSLNSTVAHLLRLVTRSRATTSSHRKSEPEPLI